ncbi:MAG: prohibitin family protein [Thermoguttaceae bacterium]|nr:prohibitin family protein [Thermoguttaceae bacterium]
MGYFVLCGILVIATFAIWQMPIENMRIDPRQRLIVALIPLVLIVVYSLSKSYTTVPPGTLGVIEVFGHLESKPLEPGLHFIRPWANVTLQETRLLVYPEQNAKDNQYEAISIDQQPVMIEMTVTYLRNNVVETMKTMSEKQEVLEEVIVVPATNEVLKDVISAYKVSEILDLRDKIRLDVQTKLTGWFARYDLTVKDVSIANVDFSDVYDQAIDEKQREKVRADQAEYELKLAETKAQEAKAEAVGRANAAIEQAKGEASAAMLQAAAKAESTMLRGKADAEAARLVGRTYTPLIHARNVIEKWDGTPPSMQIASNVGTPIMLPMPLSQLTPQTPPTPPKPSQTATVSPQSR